MDSGFSYGFHRSAINQSILPRDLHCVHVTARELCSLCLGFRFGLVEIAKIESMPLATNVVSDAEIYPARFSITVDFDNRRPAFNDNGESDSFHVFGA